MSYKDDEIVITMLATSKKKKLSFKWWRRAVISKKVGTRSTVIIEKDEMFTYVTSIEVVVCG